MKEAKGSYKKLCDIKSVLLALKPTELVYKGLGCIEVGRVPHIDNVYVEAISISNLLMKFDRN